MPDSQRGGFRRPSRCPPLAYHTLLLQSTCITVDGSCTASSEWFASWVCYAPYSRVGQYCGPLGLIPTSTTLNGLANTVRQLHVLGHSRLCNMSSCESLHGLQALLHRAIIGKPLGVLKYAMTLDGKIATSAGHAAWVSSALSRQRVFDCRARSDAVVVGGQTVRRDDPRLTTRREGGHAPVRIVMSRTLDLPQVRPMRYPLNLELVLLHIAFRDLTTHQFQKLAPIRWRVLASAVANYTHPVVCTASSTQYIVCMQNCTCKQSATCFCCGSVMNLHDALKHRLESMQYREYSRMAKRCAAWFAWHRARALSRRPLSAGGKSVGRERSADDRHNTARRADVVPGTASGSGRGGGRVRLPHPGGRRSVLP